MVTVRSTSDIQTSLKKDFQGSTIPDAAIQAALNVAGQEMHPFDFIRTVVRAILDTAGEFMDSELPQIALITKFLYAILEDPSVVVGEKVIPEYHQQMLVAVGRDRIQALDFKATLGDKSVEYVIISGGSLRSQRASDSSGVLKAAREVSGA